MRAMSLGLIKGIIDGVEEVVNVTWVQPRVLDKGQLNLLHDQLGAWTERYCTLTFRFTIIPIIPCIFPE